MGHILLTGVIEKQHRSALCSSDMSAVSGVDIAEHVLSGARIFSGSKEFMPVIIMEQAVITVKRFVNDASIERPL